MTTYLTDNEGKFIPATQRPDGTWRKARRVKEGYVPQEEVPLYESKGKQFAARRSTPLPGMGPVTTEQAKKDREKQERAKAKKEATAAGSSKKTKPPQPTPGVLLLPTAKAKNSPNAPPKNSVSNTNATVPATNVDALSKELEHSLKVQEDPLELAKKLKKLRKKLREIEAIEEKIKSGELKKPEKDQLDKVKRKKEVLKDIKRLEQEEEALQKQQTQDSV